MGSNKIKYTVTNTIAGVEIKSSAFVGTRGYGIGLSFVAPIYNSKNKKIGYVSFNIVAEVTYALLTAIAVTLVGICIVMPMITTLVKEIVKAFAVLSSPAKVGAMAAAFYRVATSM